MEFSWKMLALKFPETEGYGLSLERKGNPQHVGYTHPAAKECPCCHRYPVFEEDAYNKTDRTEPAKLFVAICPVCEMRIRGSGTLEECLEKWNQGDWSDDMWQVNHRMKDINEDGARLISDKMVKDAVEEAVKLVRAMHGYKAAIRSDRVNDFQKENYQRLLTGVRGELRSIQHFIEESPFLLDRDPEAVLSDIRRRLHPRLTPEERMKIKLKLVVM